MPPRGWDSRAGSFATGSRSSPAKPTATPRRRRRLLEVPPREDGNAEHEEDGGVDDAVCRGGGSGAGRDGKLVRCLRFQVEELQIGKDAVGGQRPRAGEAALRPLCEGLQASNQMADEKERERKRRGEDRRREAGEEHG